MNSTPLKNGHKITEELLHELKECSDIEHYLEENQVDFVPDDFASYLTQLLELKNLTRSDVIRDSCMNRAYVHQIFSGIKRPSRDKILALAFGLHLSLSEAQTLLKYGGEASLYPRIKRDSIIIYCLTKKQSIITANEILFDLCEQPLSSY